MHMVTLLLLSIYSTNVGAQEESVEKIEVTGSHIKQVDMEGRTPVQTLDREYLEKTGHNSVGDVLRELSANSFGSMRESSGSVSGGVTEVSLRGLGANRTLVLINGRRVAKDGNSGTADLNLIPLAATERIDVLKDSSSAIYGTDAVGGVVNIITKKNYNGMEFSASRSMTEFEGGDKTTINGTVGWSKGDTSVLTTLQYRNNGEIYTRNRTWLGSGSNEYSPVPNIATGDDEFKALPHCTSKKTVKTGECLFAWSDYATDLPQVEQFNLYSHARHQLNATTELDLELFGSHKKLFSQYAPGVVNLVGPDDGLSSTFLTDLFNNDPKLSALLPPGHTGPVEVKIKWRALMLGPRVTDETTNSFSVATGVTKYLGETWEGRLSLGTEHIKRDHGSLGGYAKRDDLVKAIREGRSAAGKECNIFSENGTCNINDEVGYKPYQVTTSNLHTVELSGSGEVMELPHGAIMGAMGAQLTFEDFSDKCDPLARAGEVLGGGVCFMGTGKRQVQALYTELSVPLLKDVEFNVAGRYDHYSDFGGTFNPKASLTYRPSKKLLFRGSAGTGFKAPDLNVLYTQETDGYPFLIDDKGCAEGVEGACDPHQYLVKITRPQNLKEERSFNANVGAVFQANQSLSVSLDLFHVNLEDSIEIDAEEILRAEAAGLDISSYNTTVTRNQQGGLSYIDTQALNKAQSQLNGVDLELTFKKNLPSVGMIAVSNATSYLFEYKVQGFPKLPLRSVLGDAGHPRWRNMLSVGYQPFDSFQLSTTIATIGKHEQQKVGTGELDAYTTINAQLGYDISRKWGKLTLGVNNLFNTEPPADFSNPNSPRINTSLYSNLGRFFSLGYTVNF